MKKNISWIVLSMLVLGGMFEYFFYRGLFGISVPLFLFLLYGIFILHLRPTWKQTWFSGVLFVCIILLSSTYIFFSNTTLLFLNTILLPLLVVVHFLLMVEPKVFTWYDYRGLFQIGNVFSPFLGYAKEPYVATVQTMTEKGDYKIEVARKIALGIIISIPLLVFIVGLLSSADSMFLSYLYQFGKIPQQTDILTFLIHGVKAMIITIFFWSTYRCLIGRTMYSYTLSEPKKSLSYITTSVILTAINSVYVLFVLVQFRVLFGGEQVLLERGLTYAEYAVRGFWELMVVSILNIILILGILRYVEHETKKHQLLTHVLLFAMIISSLIMLISAHMRLSLYEVAFGYTYARIFAHTIIVLLGVLLFGMSIRIFNKSFHFMKVLIVCSLILYTGLNFLNIDAFIFEKNIERFQTNKQLDRTYLMTLSLDAVPTIQRYISESGDESFRSIEFSIRSTFLQNERRWIEWNIPSTYGYKKETAFEIKTERNCEKEGSLFQLKEYMNNNTKKYDLLCQTPGKESNIVISDMFSKIPLEQGIELRMLGSGKCCMLYFQEFETKTNKKRPIVWKYKVLWQTMERDMKMAYLFKEEYVSLASSPSGEKLVQLYPNKNALSVFDLRGNRVYTVPLKKLDLSKEALYVSVIWLNEDEFVSIVYDKSGEVTREVQREIVKLYEEMYI